MDVVAVGIGGAGCRIAEKMAEYESRTGSSIADSLVAVDGSESALRGLDRIPPNARIALDIAQEWGGVADTGEATALVDTLEDRVRAAADGVLLVAGIGGATGSAVASLAPRLTEALDADVSAVAVLPSRTAGELAAATAAVTLDELTECCSSVVVFDNDAWVQRDRTDPLEREDYAAMNDELVKRLNLAFPDESAGETASFSRVLDAGGVVSIGYAAEEVESTDGGLLSRFTDDGPSDAEKTDRMDSLARKAALGRLTLPAEIDTCTEVSLHFTGPESAMTADGLRAAEQWLADNTGADSVVSAASPVANSAYLGATVLLAGVEDVPRLRELRSTAAEFGHDQFESDSNSLFDENGDDSEPLFGNDGDGGNDGDDSEPLFGEDTKSSSLTERLREGRSDTWQVEHLLALDPAGFEQVVAALYDGMGDDAALTQSGRDGGIDVVVETTAGRTLAVQVKRYAPDNTVGKPTVQQTVGAREEVGADVAVVVTTSTFSDPARTMADGTDDVRLIDGDGLVAALRESSVRPDDVL